MRKPRIRKAFSGWHCGDRPMFGNGPNVKDAYLAWSAGMYFLVSL